MKNHLQRSNAGEQSRKRSPFLPRISAPRHLLLQPKNYISIGLLWCLAAGTSGDRLAVARTQPDSIPTIAWNRTRLPDWSQIAFGSLPAIASSGSFNAPPDVSRALGYDPSRSWRAGQKPTEILKLGDFQDSFQLQNLSLEDIAAAVGLDLNQISLENFGLMKDQTIGSLIAAIHGLDRQQIDRIPPVRDLLDRQLGGDFNSSQTLADVLKQYPEVSKFSFGSIPLRQYQLTSIPGIADVPLGAFDNWQVANIDRIPGLSDLPFARFPVPPNPVGTTVAVVDVPLLAKERQIDRTISGSDVQGFNVPCTTNCAHLELGSPLLGQRWISGQYQQVRGGHGVLAAANNGREPTGRHPFGDAFKVAIWDVNEKEGTVSIAAFFRICLRNSVVDLGCTPYSIGPVQLMGFKEKQSIFVGQADAVADSQVLASSNDTPSPTFDRPAAPQTQVGFLAPAANALAHREPLGISLAALASAISEVEGNYDAVGTLVANSDRVGRGLGRYQFMSYRPDVRQVIAARPGGAEFLQKLDRGQAVSGSELLDYFDASAQDALFAKDATQLLSSAASQIDPTTGKPFAGSRLVERAAQMHFGGAGIPIDSPATDARGRLSAAEYGRQVGQRYLAALSTAPTASISTPTR